MGGCVQRCIIQTHILIFSNSHPTCTPPPPSWKMSHRLILHFSQICITRIHILYSHTCDTLVQYLDLNISVDTVAGSSPQFDTIFPAMFACWHMRLYRWSPTIRMNETWRIKQKSILLSDMILIFSLFLGCFYRKVANCTIFGPLGP